jgi:hypothetical protein
MGSMMGRNLREVEIAQIEKEKQNKKKGKSSKVFKMVILS